MSIRARRKLAEIEKRKVFKNRAGKAIKWDQWKLPQKRSKEFKIYLMVFPLLHSRAYSLKERKRMVNVYKHDIEEVKRNPNSILVMALDTVNSEVKRSADSLNDRVFMYPQKNKIKNFLKAKEDIKLITRGEYMDVCAIKFGAKLAKDLGLKPKQIKFELKESFVGIQWPRKMEIDLGLEGAIKKFKLGYGKEITERQFKKMFDVDKGLHKKRLSLAHKEAIGKGEVDKHGRVIRKKKKAINVLWDKLCTWKKALW